MYDNTAITAAVVQSSLLLCNHCCYCAITAAIVHVDSWVFGRDIYTTCKELSDSSSSAVKSPLSVEDCSLLCRL